MLQWSRTLSSPETIMKLYVTQSIFMASMEPDSFEPGNTASKLMSAGINSGLQWSRTLSSPETSFSCKMVIGVLFSFNGAGLFRARKHETKRYTIYVSHGFNGAGLFRARKRVPWTLQPLMLTASMEPDSFEPGNLWLKNPTQLFPIMLQWSRTLSSPETERRTN